MRSLKPRQEQSMSPFNRRLSPCHSSSRVLPPRNLKLVIRRLMHQPVINPPDVVPYRPCHRPPLSSQWQGLQLLKTHHRFRCRPLKQQGETQRHRMLSRPTRWNGLLSSQKVRNRLLISPSVRSRVISIPMCRHCLLSKPMRWHSLLSTPTCWHHLRRSPT